MNSKPTTVQFGNGGLYIATMTAQLNDSLKAIVVEDATLIDDLMSINPILDLDYDVLFSKNGGSIMKNNIPVLSILRSDSHWKVDLNKVKCLMTKVDDNIKEKVISLHRRLGHAPFQVMIDAIKTESWLNSSVTPENIRQVFSDYTCTICALGKRNHPPIPGSITDPTTIPIGHLLSGYYRTNRSSKQNKWVKIFLFIC
jgi:hypothetical protein